MKYRKFFIIFGLLFLIGTASFFLFNRQGITGSAIKLNSISEIPKDKNIGDCWEIKEINKTICYLGVRNLTAGKVIDDEKKDKKEKKVK